MQKIAVLLVLFFSLSASAQRLDETIEVSLVNIDVHVTDKQGNRVTGLTAADFEVRDDGRLQTITNFSEYVPNTSAGIASIEGGTPQKTPAAAAPLAAPRARRTVIVFVEPVTLAGFRATELFDAIRGLLHQTVGPGDQVSVVTFTRALRVREPFTADLAAIDKTLAQLQSEMSGAEGTTFHESSRILAETLEFEREYEDMLGAMGLGTSSEPEVSMSAVAAARRQRFLIRQKAAALESLIQSVSGADGKKIVIMATQRFGLYAGAEFFGGNVPTVYRRELDTSPIRDSLIRTANAHGVTIYPIHPEGLAWSNNPDPSISGHGIKAMIERDKTSLQDDLARTGKDDTTLFNETNALAEVAEATGGVMAWGSVAIANMLPRVADDLEAYYSIGYRTPATRQDATRSIVVTTKNPDYVVRARKQFVEKSEETEMKDRVVANLFQKVGGSSMPIPFDVALGKIRKDGRNRWAVPLKVKVPIQSLTMLPRGDEHTGEFSVYVATGNVVGVMSEVDRKSQVFRIPAADLQRAQGSHFTYEFELSVDQNANRLSIGVMDEIGKEFNLKRYTLPKR